MLFFEFFPGIRRTTPGSEEANWRIRYLSERIPPCILVSWLSLPTCKKVTCAHLLYTLSWLHIINHIILGWPWWGDSTCNWAHTLDSCKPRFNLKFGSKEFPMTWLLYTICISIVFLMRLMRNKWRVGGRPKLPRKPRVKPKPSQPLCRPNLLIPIPTSMIAPHRKLTKPLLTLLFLRERKGNKMTMTRWRLFKLCRRPVCCYMRFALGKHVLFKFSFYYISSPTRTDISDMVGRQKDARGDGEAY